MLALLHRLFRFFLVIRKQSMNLVVRFVADRVNLWSKLLPRKLSDSYLAAPESCHGAPEAEAGPAVPSYRRTGHSEHEHSPIRKRERSISLWQQPP